MWRVLGAAWILGCAMGAWCPQPGEEDLTEKLADQTYWARRSERLQRALAEVSVAQKVPVDVNSWLPIPEERELGSSAATYRTLLANVVQNREVQLSVRRAQKDNLARRAAGDRDDVGERAQAVCARMLETLSRWQQNMDEVPVQKSDIEKFEQFMRAQITSIKQLADANTNVFQGFLGDAPSEQAVHKDGDRAFWQVILAQDAQIAALQEELTALKRRTRQA